MKLNICNRLDPAIEEQEPFVWRCYDCGSTEGFYDSRDWETGIVDDIYCDKCHSSNTALDGEGTPSCPEHDNYSWFCYKCNKNMCSQCWEWFAVEEEPEDNMCSKCCSRENHA